MEYENQSMQCQDFIVCLTISCKIKEHLTFKEFQKTSDNLTKFLKRFLEILIDLNNLKVLQQILEIVGYF